MWTCSSQSGAEQVIPHVGAGVTAIAPSAIRHWWLDGLTCRPMTVEEIHAMVRKFADSAEIARNTSFDGIEVHAVHEGYLLDQFAVAFFNQRTDGEPAALRLRACPGDQGALRVRLPRGAALQFELRSWPLTFYRMRRDEKGQLTLEGGLHRSIEARRKNRPQWLPKSNKFLA
jgi:NADH:flavin oxidoreductase / NADH oxidase family